MKLALASGVLLVGMTMISQAPVSAHDAAGVGESADGDHSGGPIRVELDHPISPKAAEDLVDSVAGDISGFRFDQPGLVGEIYARTKLELRELVSTIREDHGVEPTITAVILSAGSKQTRSAQGRAIARRAASFPTFVGKRAGGQSAALATKLSGLASKAPAPKPARDLAALEVDPTPWAPGGSAISSGTVNGMAKIITWSEWSPLDSRDAALMPVDRGLEVETNLYNPDNSGIRPLCLPLDAPNRFWFGSLPAQPAITAWTLSTPTSSLNPAVYGAYADTVTFSDGCDRQSISIGIGYPRSPPDWSPTVSGFMTTAYGYPGSESSSAFSAGYQAVTNDCATKGEEPASECMGLNQSADMPNGWDESSLIVNKDRNWSIPTCVRFDYGSDPFQLDPAICQL